jgi:predicted transcriptional regulator
MENGKMSGSVERTRSRTITLKLPEALLNRLDERMSPQQRTDFIVEAIEEHLAIQEQVAALDEAAGAWTDENHPEMVTPESMDLWLAELRGSWMQDDGATTA